MTPFTVKLMLLNVATSLSNVIPGGRPEPTDQCARDRGEEAVVSPPVAVGVQGELLVSSRGHEVVVIHHEPVCHVLTEILHLVLDCLPVFPVRNFVD